MVKPQAVDEKDESVTIASMDQVEASTTMETPMPEKENIKLKPTKEQEASVTVSLPEKLDSLTEPLSQLTLKEKAKKETINEKEQSVSIVIAGVDETTENIQDHQPEKQK